MHHKKVISKTCLTNMSKKVPISVTFFANNFFWVHLKKKFVNGFEISVKFWVF
jgi:hypothetical protein